MFENNISGKDYGTQMHLVRIKTWPVGEAALQLHRSDLRSMCGNLVYDRLTGEFHFSNVSISVNPK